jgi:hypothetical protein
LVIVMRIGFQIASEVLLNHGKVERKGHRPHEHEIFLVTLRILTKPAMRLFEGQAPKRAPRMLGVQIAIDGIEVMFGR